MASSTSISISFTLFLITINYPIPSTALVEVHYADCASSNSTCNSSQEISYPFWENPLKNYCGHPGFKLDCVSASLTIQIVNETYNVLDINYTSNVFTVVRRNFSQGACPQTRNELTNSTLNSNLFNYTSSSETVALFYNCSTKPDAGYPGNFPCQPDIYGQTVPDPFYSSVNFLAIDPKWKNQLWTICRIGIYLPVITKNVIALKNGSLNVDGVVNGGFELTWVFDKKYCQDCSTSGGRCGYNYTLAQPVCFCRDAISNQTCTLTYTTSTGEPLDQYEEVVADDPGQE